MHPRKKFISLEKNTAGHDFTIGDIHGNLNILKRAIDQLSENDRLFFVGDLTDKGQHSQAVLDRILEHNKLRVDNGRKPQLFAVRGNHEELFLRYADFRIEHPDKPNPHKAILVHPKNRGEWATQLNNDDLKKYRRYFRSLPDIIHVDGDDPFHVVHADMPVSDRQLARMFRDNLQLNRTQRYHARWARNGTDMPLAENIRNAASIPAYCGHTIFGGIRYETNHLNLDSGAYKTKQALFVDHTEGQCYILKTNRNAKSNQEIEKICLRIQDELDFRQRRRVFCAEIRRKTPQEINEHILDLVTRASSIEKQKETYLTELENISPLLSEDQKDELLHFLVQQREHLLKKERHFGWLRFHRHSIQTRSMHIAANILCDGIQNYQPAKGAELTRHITEFSRRR